MSTLLLTTIVLLVAATMAGVFTLNMNMTQRVSNGTIALSEAEAGISEVLYQISRDENLGENNSERNPIVTWGMNNETIRSTITPGMSEEEAYHVITFDSGSSFPHSTNNTDLAHNSGSLGRTVPDGKIHLVSTGYCKGQYRVVECLIERPPFPFGLAASGPIHSKDPLKVKGVYTLSDYQNGNEERPGHVLSNSTKGIKIDQVSPPVPTEISGFVKSVGPVDIDQPATVRGGIRTGADLSTLPSIDIDAFRNQGQPGVVTIIDDNFSKEQNLDIMYYHPGPVLRYGSQVNLKNGLLFCEGDLIIEGPVTGEGLIITKGRATFLSGTSLSGDNRMAVLSGGDMTIRGNNNYFSGLVYCEGNLDASDITIVGNTIVNSATNGAVDLKNVTIVANEETADMTITVTSSTVAKSASQSGNFPFPLQWNNNGFGMTALPGQDPGLLKGWPDPNSDPAGIAGTMTGRNPYTGKGNADQENLWNVAMNTRDPLVMTPSVIPSNAVAIYEEFKALIASANSAQAMNNEILDKVDELKGMADDDPGRDDLEKKIADLKDSLGEAQLKFDAAAFKLAKNIDRLMDENVDSNGTFDDGTVPMDITQDHRFNLNEYLPESEKIKISFWKVYPRRL